MEHGDAIRMVQDLRAILDDKDRELESRGRQLVRKDALILKMKDRDIRRREERRKLQEELARAKNNIGELNSMIVRQERSIESFNSGARARAETLANQVQRIRELERTLESVRRAHENQAITIAEQGNMIHALNLEKASLEGLHADLVQESRELQARIREGRYWAEDSTDQALVDCKKKMEQLEGMLEAQRRNTRELGVNLQNTRDVLAGTREDLRAMTVERDQWQKRAQVAEEKIAETRAQAMAQRNDQVPIGRLLQALRERDDHLKQLQDLQQRVNRAKSILNPVKVTETWDGDARITWDPPSTLGGGVTVRKAEPPMRRCGGLLDSHSCIRTYNPGGPVHHGAEHLCHCGWRWPW
jgi:chromosome segregation ATPase